MPDTVFRSLDTDAKTLPVGRAEQWCCAGTPARGVPFLSVFILIKLCELGKKQCGFFPQRRYV